jgi:hypothetical protein
MKIKKFSIASPEVRVNPNYKVVDTGLFLVVCTQEEYDAMQTHDSNTLYFVTEDEEEV